MKTMLQEAQTSKHVTLQLTSMVDMFMIIVVFLLKSMSVSSVTMPAQDLRLPQSAYGKEPREMLLVQVSPNYIALNNRKLINLEKGKIRLKDLSEDDGSLIEALKVSLSKEAEKTKKIQEQTGNLIKFNGQVFIQADKGLEYGTLRKVFYTASLAGYGDLRLATVSGGE